LKNNISLTSDNPEDLSKNLDILRGKLNLISLEEISGGYTHQTYLGTTKEGVKFLIKVAIKPIHNEVIANNFLNGINIKPIPKLIESFLINNTEIIIQEYIEGSRNIFDAIEDIEFEVIKDHFQQLGKLIAEMHLKSKQDFPDVEFQYSVTLPEDINYIDEELKHRALELIDKLKDINDQLVLCHGDFGPQNSIVTKENKVYLIDFEQVHWGNPYEDLGWFYWITILHYPDKAKELLQSFNKGYLSIRDIELDYEKMKAFAIRKIWSVLPEKVAESIETRKAWIGRLELALRTDFNTN